MELVGDGDEVIERAEEALEVGRTGTMAEGVVETAVEAGGQVREPHSGIELV